MLISDALALAGMGDGRITIGGLEVEVSGERCVLADGSGTLAGSVIALDTAVRNLVREGASLPFACAAAGANPLAMLGVTDRGRIAVGQRADLVELDAELNVRRVMRAGRFVGCRGRSAAALAASRARDSAVGLFQATNPRLVWPATRLGWRRQQNLSRATLVAG